MAQNSEKFRSCVFYDEGRGRSHSCTNLPCKSTAESDLRMSTLAIKKYARTKKIIQSENRVFENLSRINPIILFFPYQLRQRLQLLIKLHLMFRGGLEAEIQTTLFENELVQLPCIFPHHVFSATALQRAYQWGKLDQVIFRRLRKRSVSRLLDHL